MATKKKVKKAKAEVKREHKPRVLESLEDNVTDIIEEDYERERIPQADDEE